MSRRKHIDEDSWQFEASQRQCDHKDCHEAGEFRAPRTRIFDRGSPEDYQWFCLNHVREFNKSWNFFDGMTDDEVLRYKDEDITGHRPTWKMGTRTATPRQNFYYDDPFDFRSDMGADQKAEANGHGPRPALDQKELDALAILNLEPGCSLKEIKKRHNELAKKYHPDIRGGDKRAEEILKNINQAYTHLRSCANS